MLLGSKTHAAGEKIRYTIDYSGWLFEGESIASATVALDDEFTATVTDVTITVPDIHSSTEVVYYLDGGSVDEIFTVAVQATTSFGEIKNDTMSFFITAP